MKPGKSVTSMCGLKEVSLSIKFHISSNSLIIFSSILIFFKVEITDKSPLQSIKVSSLSTTVLSILNSSKQINKSDFDLKEIILLRE